MTGDLANTIKEMGIAAKKAADVLTYTDTDTKNRALARMAELIREKAASIQEENAKDLAAGREAGLTEAMLDRLELNDKRISGMISGIQDIISLPDPVGRNLWSSERPSGIHIEKVSVPIGAIGIIYESRPNVTADAASLCIKAGNSVFLKGGKESIRSNLAIANALRQALTDTGLPADAVQVVASTDRQATQLMLQLDEYLDLIMPRGGEGLIRFVAENSKIPVIKHYKGVCAIYVDRDCDQDLAVNLIVNAKAQRPGVCNSIENLFLHTDIAAELAAKLIPAFDEAAIEPICGTRAAELFPDCPAATEEDWHTEYLDLRLTIGIVDSLNEAVARINACGSQHSDAIVTANEDAAAEFLLKVNSAAVYHNTSTRFTDGGEFGLGAEIGISTDKLHARGPMGLEELCIYKYVVRSDGAVRT